jgi:hypothetical protein
MPTEDANYHREVRLSSEALNRFRTAENAAFKSLDEMAALIVETMEGSSERLGSLEKMTFFRGAQVLCVHGPEYCYCYDGKAGVCRPCTADEEVMQP